MRAVHTVANPATFAVFLALAAAAPTAAIVAVAVIAGKPTRTSATAIAILQILVLISGTEFAVATIPIVVLLSSPSVRRFYSAHVSDQRPA